MKKILSAFICLMLMTSIFTGCGATSQGSSDSKKLKIVTTIFPEYDWVRNIVGEKENNIELTMLIDNGVDLHSYQPSTDDIVKISKCDIFIYVGGESDEWVDDALKQAANKEMIVINLLDVLGDKVKTEEHKEGMEHDHDHDDHDESDHDDHDESDHDDHDESEHDHEHEDEEEKDEHVWLSLKNASALCEHICDKICEKDSAGKDTYKSNTKAYIEKLEKLDKQYKEAVDAAGNKTLVFADRFPFRYLTDDYGLDYFAAFAGCSAESEASFETVIFLAKKVDELGLKSIVQIEGSKGDIAKTVKDNTKSKDQQILTLDSLQSVTKKDVDGGLTYLGEMEKNLDVIKDALK
ncbi:MAG: zinc ABC transporter substrate-binding protein [Ruminococcus sp.]|nr:zinc ABC transporter substrate-binding protein [Ruminococcus sp.]